MELPVSRLFSFPRTRDTRLDGRDTRLDGVERYDTSIWILRTWKARRTIEDLEVGPGPIYLGADGRNKIENERMEGSNRCLGRRVLYSREGVQVARCDVILPSEGILLIPILHILSFCSPLLQDPSNRGLVGNFFSVLHLRNLHSVFESSHKAKSTNAQVLPLLTNLQF
ncbi:hypothetical protein BD289DRAFT_162793 [Coniella lustricola]|uniref:Uncharacterized protein n=1 Tax=Coniella lustricola TaxID=2025994 RepID=A0A2T3AE88_9PEZI|nr:hypothetical protein BD289DRAFT_162793 [Coniella lustricola]